MPAGGAVFWNIDPVDASVTLTEALVAATSADRAVELKGVITNGANAGDLQLQWAQQVATVENTRVFADSHILAFKLN